MRFFEKRTRAQWIAEGILGVIGIAWLVIAWRANLRWCERHMMPFYFALTPDLVRSAHLWRCTAFLIGVVFVGVLRPIIGRWVQKLGGREALATSARYGVAIFFALGVSELGMRHFNWPRASAAEQIPAELRIAQPDNRYGWVFVGPGRTEIHRDNRVVNYDINADHNRASAVTDLPDPSKPTILFAGESITAGFGLEWDETFPALVGAALDAQVVNLGMHAYANTQSFARLADALPRFEHPIAIISMFLASILMRMDSYDHPHLVFHADDTFDLFPPPHPFWKDLHLLQVAANLVPYNPHADETLALAAKIFKRTADLANARGAKIIFVGPRFGESRGDAYLIDELFTKQSLPFLDVDVGPERLPNDVHPAQAGTRKIADAIVAALAKDGITSR
jgi:lysophospholipase L1-like esterase